MSAMHIRNLLALSMAAALLAPGVALAQSAKEKELEARVAQLEQQVQGLLQAMQSQQATIARTQTALDDIKVAPAAPAAADGKPAIQSTPILTAGNPGSRFSFGYPACPRVEDQTQLLALLGAERIGVTLSEEFQLEPEQSTSAIVTVHPQAKYFSV